MQFWQHRKVLVSGCSGLIGGPLCKALLERGAEVAGLDTTWPGMLRWHGIYGKFRHISADITNREHIRNLMVSENPSVVFHLAAVSNVEHSRAMRYDTFRINVLGTLNVLDACNPSMAAVMVPSSNHVYGRQATEGSVGEDAPMNQLDTYSASKAMADILTRSYAHNYQIPTVAVRNTNCYGAYDPHGGHLVPSVVNAILDGKNPTLRSAGTTVKSYLYVDDVVDAYLLLAEGVASGHFAMGEAFNVADTWRHDALLVANTIMRLMPEAAGKMLTTLDQANDQADEFLDSFKIKSFTGWLPKHTLEQGLTKAIAGLREMHKERVTA